MGGNGIAKRSGHLTRPPASQPYPLSVGHRLKGSTQFAGWYRIVPRRISTYLSVIYPVRPGDAVLSARSERTRAGLVRCQSIQHSPIQSAHGRTACKPRARFGKIVEGFTAADADRYIAFARESPSPSETNEMRT